MNAAAFDLVRVATAPISAELTESAAALLRSLVAAGAALGWVDPPPAAEIETLLNDVADHAAHGDAALVTARSGRRLVGLGYWLRYARPTHRPHADLEKLAVDPAWQGRGVGRAMMRELIDSAARAGIEVLTLDLRADNDRAVGLYESLGFRGYGRLSRFVAVGDARYDKLCYALDLRGR